VKIVRGKTEDGRKTITFTAPEWEVTYDVGAPDLHKQHFWTETDALFCAIETHGVVAHLDPTVTLVLK
jgi:hypothetical protein